MVTYRRRRLAALAATVLLGPLVCCSSDRLSSSATPRPCSTGGAVTAYIEKDATDREVNDLASLSMRADSFTRQVVSGSSNDQKRGIVRFDLCGEATRSEVAAFRKRMTESEIVERTTFRDAPRSRRGLTGSVKTISSGQAELSGRRTCADFSIRWSNPRNGGSTTDALVTAESPSKGRVLTLRGTDSREQLVPIWCGDINADGTTELGIERYGQSDCCRYVARVVTLDGPTLLDMKGVDLTPSEPAQLDRTVPLEIVADWEMLAYDDYLPTLGFMRLPIVLVYRDDKYVEHTRPYRKAIREAADVTRGFLEEEADRDDNSPATRTLALGLLGHYFLLGDERVGFDEVAKLVSESANKWVRKNFAEVTRRIDETYSD